MIVKTDNVTGKSHVCGFPAGCKESDGPVNLRCTLCTNVLQTYAGQVGARIDPDKRDTVVV